MSTLSRVLTALALTATAASAADRPIDGSGLVVNSPLVGDIAFVAQPDQCPGVDDPPIWIAISDQLGCPAIDGWGVTRLFPHAPRGPLTRFCRYERAGDFGTFPDHAKLRSAAPDCVVSAPQSVPRERTGPHLDSTSTPGGTAELPAERLDDHVGPIWRAAHDARLDLPTSAPDPSHDVTVVVLDTGFQVTEGDPADLDLPTLGLVGAEALITTRLGPFEFNLMVSPHGPAMEALIERLVPAGVLVERRGAMTEAASRAAGVFYGRPGQLAATLHAAVGDHRDSDTGRLVVNISAGWPRGRMFRLPELDDAMRLRDLPRIELARRLDPFPQLAARGMLAPEQAVYAALLEAACADALVVAAVGNDPLGLGDPRALLPARWATEAAPSPAECRRLKGDPARLSAELDAPLLIAVGGVDLTDAPFAATRPGSLPPLVAPAENVAVQVAERWRVFSGTSGATAYVSAAAATLWAHAPDLDAQAVAAALYTGGVELGAERTASLYRGSEMPRLRRLSLCGALTAAGVVDVQCAATVPAGDTTAREELLEALTVPFGASTTSACALTVAEYDVAADIEASTSVAPQLAPQPEWPMCPSCYVDLDTLSLVAELDAKAPLIEKAVLSGETPDGRVEIDVTEGFLALQASGGVTAMRVDALADDRVETFAKARLTFVVEGDKEIMFARSNPIYIK